MVGDTESEFQATQDPEGYIWRFDARSPGGHLFDDVMHKYAMALWLVDEEIKAFRRSCAREDCSSRPRWWP